jgi:hypothetical protein
MLEINVRLRYEPDELRQILKSGYDVTSSETAINNP